jgi:hypothetical protein
VAHAPRPARPEAFDEIAVLYVQTCSDRSRLTPADHARFLADMARVIDRAGGTVTREDQTVTLLARRT